MCLLMVKNSIQRLFNPAKITYGGGEMPITFFHESIKVMDLELKGQFTKIAKKKKQTRFLI